MSMALYLYGSNKFGIGEPAKILTVIRKGFLWCIKWVLLLHVWEDCFTSQTPLWIHWISGAV